jgi:hypothetical protein
MKSDRRRRGVLGRALALIWWSRRLANSSKHPLNVLVQRSHDANPRKHRRPAETRDLDQSFHGSLPFRRRVIGLRQAGDVVAGIAQSHDLAPTGQQDRIIERASPDGNRLQTCDQLSVFRNVLNVQFAFSSAGPGAAILGRLQRFPELLTEFVQLGDLNKEIGRVTGEN